LLGVSLRTVHVEHILSKLALHQPYPGGYPGLGTRPSHHLAKQREPAVNTGQAAHTAPAPAVNERGRPISPRQPVCQPTGESQTPKLC
jgi:hypothetical protein